MSSPTRGRQCLTAAPSPGSPAGLVHGAAGRLSAQLRRSRQFQELPHPHGPAEQLPGAGASRRFRSETNWFCPGVVHSASTDRASGSWDSLQPALVMLQRLCCMAALCMMRLPGGRPTGTPMAPTPQGHRAGGILPLQSSFTFQVLPCLFCPLGSCVTLTCSSLGRKLFFRMFFARLLLQQDCSLNQCSSNVINKLLHKWELHP